MNETIKKLKIKFANSLPRRDEKLIQAFENYLVNSVENYKKPESIFSRQDDSFIQSVIENIAETIIQLPDVEAKKRELYYDDENYETVRMASGRIFKVACEKVRGTTITEEIIKKIDNEMKKIVKTIKKVKKCNMQNAEQDYENAKLDYYFIKGQGEEISFRLNREMQRILEEKNIKEER